MVLTTAPAGWQSPSSRNNITYRPEIDSDSDTLLIATLDRRVSPRAIMSSTAADAGDSPSHALGAGAGASELAGAAAAGVINLGSDENALPATASDRVLVWLSGPITPTPPPTSSDSTKHPPAAAEIITLVSSPDDKEVINLVSSSDEGEEVNSTVEPARSDSDYDPTEKQPLAKQQKHYKDLGRKMEYYGEMKLKRIMENPKTSIEDYQEVEYQLHFRFPKHKQGRAN